MKLIISLATIFFSVFLPGCVSLKQQELFDTPSGQKPPQGIENFYGLEIFEDNLGNEVWYTKSPYCLTVKIIDSVFYSGKKSMLWKWNKNAGSCPWLGVGFGWDGWSPKDLSRILDKAAIQMQVRTVTGKLKALPLAAALEDYSGAQAWLGFSSSTIQGPGISEEWTTILLPLAEFNWEQNSASPDIIKQFIVQFEAEGSIYVDDIRVVPFEGGFRKRMHSILMDSAEITIDGIENEFIWKKGRQVTFNENTIKLIADTSNIYLNASIVDANPFMNDQQGDNIWNGDAFEMAFSTDPDLSQRRIRFRTSDQHIAISINNDPVVWDFVKHQAIMDAKVSIVKTESGCNLEARIPWKYFECEPFSTGKVYGVEFALDNGDESGSRTNQLRWNNPDVDGFYNNPFLWGELVFEKYGQASNPLQ